MKKVVILVKRSTPEEVVDRFGELGLARLAKAKGVSVKEMAAIIADAINNTLKDNGYKLLN